MLFHRACVEVLRLKEDGPMGNVTPKLLPSEVDVADGGRLYLALRERE